MGYALKYQQELVTESCGGCGIEFAVPAALHGRFAKEGAAIRCPNPACPWPSMSIKETEAARLKKELEAATAARRWAEKSLEAEVAAHALTKKSARKRAAAGVCQCCNRTFQNVARHMKTKHPEAGK